MATFFLKKDDHNTCIRPMHPKSVVSQFIIVSMTHQEELK